MRLRDEVFRHLAIAFDVLKASAGPLFMQDVRYRDWVRAGAAFVVGVVTLAVSLVAAFGSAQHVREASSDERPTSVSVDPRQRA